MTQLVAWLLKYSTVIIFLVAFVIISIGAIGESPFTTMFGIIVLFTKPINQVWSSLFSHLQFNSNIVSEFEQQLKADLSQAEYERIIKKVIESSFSEKTKYNFLARLIKNNPFPEVKSFAGIKLAEFTDYTDKRAIYGLLITISDNKFHRRADTIVKSIHKYGKHVEQPLIDMLDHNWRHAREHAAKALGNLKSKKAILKLIERLKIINDNSVHHYIIDALVKIEANEAIETIRFHLTSETIDTVLSSLKAVKYFEDRDAIETVFDLLNHSSPNIQQQALETAVVFGDDTLEHFHKYVNYLITSKEQYPNNGNRILIVLKAIGEKITTDSSIDFLVTYIKNDDSDVRLGAIVGLGLSSNKRAIPYLEKHCQDSYWGNQALSAFYIGEMGYKDSAYYLLPLLEHEIPVVRYFSAFALGKLKSVESVTKLIALLEDSKYISTCSPVSARGKICNVAANSLETIGTPEALEALEEWREKQSDDE